MASKDPEIVESFDDIEIYKKKELISKVAITAMEKEKEKNKKLGIPSVFMQGDQILYELPDGTITTESPWES